MAIRSGKLIGYCPDCNLPIVSYEVKNNVYTCSGCGSKKKVAKLLKERILAEKYIPEVEEAIEGNEEVEEVIEEQDELLNDIEE